FRSAWIPAPPPESEPAIVNARGTSAGKVIPSSRVDLALSSPGVDGGEPAIRDLTHFGEGDAEPILELVTGTVDRGPVHRGEQLVVLAAGERDLQGVGLHDLGELEQPRRDRDRVQVDPRADGALRAETREVQEQAVAHV